MHKFKNLKIIIKITYNGFTMKNQNKMALVVFMLVSIATSCTKSPEALAKEYCKCKQNPEQQNCAEMAEAHFLQLQDEPELLQKYSAAVTECVITPPSK